MSGHFTFQVIAVQAAHFKSTIYGHSLEVLINDRLYVCVCDCVCPCACQAALGDPHFWKGAVLGAPLS